MAQFTGTLYDEASNGDLDENNHYIQVGAGTTVKGTLTLTDQDQFTLDVTDNPNYSHIVGGVNPRAVAPGTTVSFSLTTSDPNITVTVHSSNTAFGNTAGDLLVVHASGNYQFTMPSYPAGFYVSTHTDGSVP